MIWTHFLEKIEILVLVAISALTKPNIDPKSIRIGSNHQKMRFYDLSGLVPWPIAEIAVVPTLHLCLRAIEAHTDALSCSKIPVAY